MESFLQKWKCIIFGEASANVCTDPYIYFDIIRCPTKWVDSEIAGESQSRTSKLWQKHRQIAHKGEEGTFFERERERSWEDLFWTKGHWGKVKDQGGDSFSLAELLIYCRRYKVHLFLSGPTTDCSFLLMILLFRSMIDKSSCIWTWVVIHESSPFWSPDSILVRFPFISITPAAAAAAKSLQSCPTLCDPIDGSLPGFPVPGILQARSLEWVATSFSNAGKWKVKVGSHLVVSDSQRPLGLQPARLLRPWDFLGKNTGVGCHFLLQCMKVRSESEVTQSCLTLSDPVDCSPPGSSVLGIFQARVLEWVAIAFSFIQWNIPK